ATVTTPTSGGGGAAACGASSPLPQAARRAEARRTTGTSGTRTAMGLPVLLLWRGNETGTGTRARTAARRTASIHTRLNVYSPTMVRRSKEDALATRTSLLDAAERAFLEKGVAGTSLNDIAVEAGTTRGAIYWHFRDKADLFNAMMQRVVMPLQFA